MSSACMTSATELKFGRLAVLCTRNDGVVCASIVEPDMDFDPTKGDVVPSFDAWRAWLAEKGEELGGPAGTGAGAA